MEVNIKRAADLRSAMLAEHLFCVDDAASREFIAALFARRLAEHPGVLRVWPEAGEDAARGFYLEWYEASSWFGVPTRFVMTDAAWGDEAAQGWCSAQVAGLDAAGDAAAGVHVELHVPAWCGVTLAGAQEAGFRVSSVQLVGEVGRALASQRVGAAWPAEVEVVGLEEAHVGAVMTLWRDTFRREPQWCWFGANPTFLERYEAGLRAPVLGLGRRVVLVEGGSVQGFVAWDAAETPGWGVSAGQGIVLGPGLRGRGLLRGIYRRMLAEMEAAQVRVFSGGTSQPPVMKLAMEQGRAAGLVHLRRWEGFEAGHFAPFLA